MTDPPTSPGTNRRRRGLETKARIVDAALRLFSERGFAATSTRQIAEAAGVAEGLIFHYFPTKMDLLLSIPETRRTFSSHVATTLAGAAGRPATECLPALADGFVRMVRSEQPFLNMMIGESRTNDTLYALSLRFLEGTSDALAAYLDTRVDAGELRPDLATGSAARAFFGPLILFSLTNRHLTDEEWTERASRHTAELLDLWFRGAVRNG